MDIYHPVKTCSKCGIEKSITEFNKDNRSKSGLQSKCIGCRREHYHTNKEKYKQKNKEYHQNNKEIIISKLCPKCGQVKLSTEFNKDNNRKDGLQYQCKSCLNNYRSDNNNRIKLYGKTYRTNNKEKRNTLYKERLKADPVFKLQHNIRGLIRKSIKQKGYRKNTKTADILGCDWDTLKEHLEFQFDENMNWNNQGTYWDIDHIIPVSSANTEEEVIKLNHYTNLQPLESYYNRHVKRNVI